MTKHHDHHRYDKAENEHGEDIGDVGGVGHGKVNGARRFTRFVGDAAPANNRRQTPQN